MLLDCVSLPCTETWLARLLDPSIARGSGVASRSSLRRLSPCIASKLPIRGRCQSRGPTRRKAPVLGRLRTSTQPEGARVGAFSLRVRVFFTVSRGTAGYRRIRSGTAGYGGSGQLSCSRFAPIGCRRIHGFCPCSRTSTGSRTSNSLPCHKWWKKVPDPHCCCWLRLRPPSARRRCSKPG